MENLQEGKIKTAMNWFKQKVKDLFTKKAVITKKSFDIVDMKSIQEKMHFMNLYTMAYPDPLWKDDLPYFDALPLFFPVTMSKSPRGNVLLHGLNIHFLQYDARKALLTNIAEVIDKGARRVGFDPDVDDYNKLAYAQLTKFVGPYINKIYLGVLGTNDMKKIRICYRTYALQQISTQIKRIKTSEWENAVDLITPNFQKQAAGEIYKDISQLYNKYKNRSWNEIY